MVYVVYLIQALAYLLKLAILARALISWMHTDPYNPVVHFLYRVTEPLLRPLRQVLPTWRGVDISPVVALVIIQLVEWLLVRLIVLA
jgi:YggT family protein